MLSCIYKILNKTNGKFYIGSAYNFNKRKWVHLCLLRAGKHHNKHLQSAWNMNGEDSFEFIVLQICNKSELIKYEQFWLDWTKCYKKEIGYNTCVIAGNTVGYKHTKEFKAWQANRVSGNKHSDETKEKMSNSAKKPKTKEHAANISKGKTGKSRFTVIVTGTPLTQKEDGSWH